MDDLKKRINKLENVITTLVSGMKKIEDVKKKNDLYNFTNQQLMKWLKDNEVNYNENIKDALVDIVWKNLNEWEWEYYDEIGESVEESEEEEEEEEEEESEEIKNESEDSSSDELDEELENSGCKSSKKKMTVKK